MYYTSSSIVKNVHTVARCRNGEKCVFGEEASGKPAIWSDHLFYKLKVPLIK